ncbi:MBOAT family O-acyltransferase [Autumnicola psychrophila]|uniref:MBOAT family O-acyltransferase n=1 Tax=Autumnicola psychrophila TaxID=3075592 RepID=A0ABU3DUP7_9FLAO|nr:MBOAT family O-acyltransferase [Zunongwangia sp. F225]MDT0687441.1 MBOAT family O-acyltransferase [Zunongwangia sp. F225]
MLFNSFEYAVFLPLVFGIYWLIGSKKLKLQNLLILGASYTFYGFWDWRFVILIFLSSIVDYYTAILISQSSSAKYKKLYLLFSLVWNLGVLFTFKYYDFFVQSFLQTFNLTGANNFALSFEIILPVGLSFYTFQTISYTIDVYKNKIKPTNHLLEFLCYVSFFPQLVAGPIERTSFLLPQFFKKRQFSLKRGKEGLRQILWGLFKKIVVADNLALAVDTFFAKPSDFQSWELFYGLVLFYFQIYADFSGYTDIALGSAKLFGFKLHVNFNLPHFARGIPDFWRRWNITLSQWFRDYVHIPFLQNRKKTPYNRYVALILTFGLIGLWHGAEWTFILFGLIHALYMILYQIYYKRIGTIKTNKLIPGILINMGAIGLSFTLLVLSIVFFRAPNYEVAFTILERIFRFIPDHNFESIIKLNIGFLFLMLLMEIFSQKKEYPFEDLEKLIPRLVRWCIYYIFVYLIIRYGGPKESFIYFQF